MAVKSSQVAPHGLYRSAHTLSRLPGEDCRRRLLSRRGTRRLWAEKNGGLYNDPQPHVSDWHSPSTGVNPET